METSETLSAELSYLSKQQSKALQASAYISMNAEEAREYDKRRLPIAELCALIGEFKPSRTGSLAV
jgi:hypothetical protein